MYLEAPVHFSLGAFPSLQYLVEVTHFCQGFMLGTPCCWCVPILDPPETSEVNRNAHQGIFRCHIWFLPQAGKKINWGPFFVPPVARALASMASWHQIGMWCLVQPLRLMCFLNLFPSPSKMLASSGQALAGRTIATFGRVSPTGHPCLSPCMWT